jgi:hypothetical protein
MQKKLFIIILMAGMLIMVMGFAPGPAAQINKITQAATPTPVGQITVPGFTIQIHPPGPNPLLNKPDSEGRTASVWLGVWHGLISPATLVMSFINPATQMYEVHNDGNLYNLGFLIGVAIIFLILGALAGSRR